VVTEVTTAAGTLLVGLQVTGTPAADEAGGAVERWQVLTVRGGRIADIRGFGEFRRGADHQRGLARTGRGVHYDAALCACQVGQDAFGGMGGELGRSGFLGSTRYGVLGEPDILVGIADWESAEARDIHMKEAAATGAYAPLLELLAAPFRATVISQLP
jgi:hypothetical protein